MKALFDSLLADAPARSIPIQPLYGGSLKAVHKMNLEELGAISERVMAKVQEAAFSRGLPVIGEAGGDTVRHYADGRTEPVR
jgi:hypothetical protein